MPSPVFNEKNKVNKIKDILLDLFCFFVLLTTFLVFLPAQVYYNPINVAQYNYYFYEYSIPVMCLVIAAAFIYSLLLLFVSRRIRIVFSVLTVALTFLLLFQSNILNWSYGLLDGSRIEWARHILQGVVDTLLWIGVLVVALIYSKSFHEKYLKNTVLFLFVFQLVWVSYLSLNYHFSEKSKDTNVKAHYLDETNKFSFSKQDNVIIIVLDTYRSDIFNEIIHEDGFYRDIFKDFTYYRNNIGGYPSTVLSIPLILTGQYYDHTTSFAEYIKKAYLADSLPGFFLKQGYDVTLPLYNEIFISPDISNNYHKKTMNAAEIIENLKNVRFRMGAIMLHPLPTLLKFLAFKIILSDKIHVLPTDDLIFLNDFLNSFNVNNKRNTFKFYHLCGAHHPFIINDDLEYESMPYSLESLKKQSKANLKICKIIFEYLKRDKIFDNSLIIVMSDHGNIDYDMVNPRNGKKVENIVIKGALPLLLIKKRLSQQKDIQISDQPTTHGDLRKMMMNEFEPISNRVRNYYLCLLPTPEDPVTEYRVTGHAWDEKSWQPTGKTLPENK